jgi:hypothetical protein
MAWLVQDPIATYFLVVISISQTEVKPNVKDFGFLLLTAQYLDPYYSKHHPESVAS